MTSFVEVHPSRCWKWLLVAIHLLAVFAVLASKLNAWLAGALIAVLVCSLALYLYTGVFEPFTLDLPDRLSKVGAGGTARLILTPATRVWGPLILLRLSDGTRKRNYVLLADSVGGVAEWARLRRHLRWLTTAK